MTHFANTFRADFRDGSFGLDFDLLGHDLICRDESCQQLGLHSTDSGCCIRRKGRACDTRTRSRVNAAAPWRANCHSALHESVYTSISGIEPRNFATIIHLVENDYGSCCERTVHRHLERLRIAGKIVRMDFRRRVHAYLRAGSRLIGDPALVFEQVMNLHACEAA